MGVIRLLLAMSVLVGHAGGFEGLRFESGQSAILVNGDTAVQTFYLISGFYMALVWDHKYTSAGVFWLSRYLRLAPVYLLISLATAITLYLSKGGVGLYSNAPASDVALALISNLTMIGQDLFMFLGYSPQTGFVFSPFIFEGGLNGLSPAWGFLLIEQGWSIGVEMWFYLLVPFVLGRSTRVLIVLIGLSLLARILAKYYGVEGGAWTYRFFPFELGVFLTGSVMARMRDRFVLRRYPGLLLGIVILFIVLYPHVPFYETFRRIGVVALVALSLPTLFDLSRHWKVDRWIGELSYPVYITHMLVLMWLPVSPLSGFWCAVVSVVFSAALMVFIEAPVNKFRAKLYAK